MNPATTSAETKPVPQAVLELARAAVKEFRECFWFRHPDAVISSGDDVRVVVEHLREYGDRKTWRVAQNIQRCL